MLRKLTQRIQSEESGFTLIELLVVILIIGILAAIALPAFLGQQKKGQDASSKSDARNLVSQIEACFANEQAYTNCMPKADGTLGGDATGLKIGGSGRAARATRGRARCRAAGSPARTRCSATAGTQATRPAGGGRRRR